MMKPRWLAGTCVVSIALALGNIDGFAVTAEDHSGAQYGTGTSIDLTYQPSNEDFPNPERGFFRVSAPFFVGSHRHALTVPALRGFRNGGTALIRAYYVIDEFGQMPLTQGFLRALAADFTAVRSAGLKMIPRFAYSFPCFVPNQPCTPENYGPTDAPLGRVLGHIDQLAPVLRANSDVLAFMEMGFVGAWGEWHNSTNNLLTSTRTINANSVAIVDRVLSALPIRRMAAFRYPSHKQALYGASPLTAQQAFSGIPKARVGAHNDCFLSDRHDSGTYESPIPPSPDPEWFKQYLNADNRYLPQGGETCSSAPAAVPYIQCANALSELARLRWSTINTDFNPAVIDLWKTQGCYAEISRRLGYRFRLVGGQLPSQAPVGGVLRMRLDVANDGWATPYNPRTVEIVLRHTATRREYFLPVNTDPRLWEAGETQSVDVAVTVPPGIHPGTYALLLNLPDPEPSLRGRPEYSIRFANPNLWEATTGYNDLGATVAIQSGQAVILQPPVVIGSTVTLRWGAAVPGDVIDYVLEAGSGSGLTNIYNASVGAATRISATVGSGAYYVRVRARGAANPPALSNEVVVLVGGGPCTSLPQTPSGVFGWLSGGVAAVGWNQVPDANSYVVEAGSSLGGSDVFSGNVGASLIVSTAVAPGFRAFVRVYAENPCGRSPASAEILIE